MIFSEHVFLYCERGSDTALLAEPANAASNLGYIFVALAGFWLLWRRPSERDAADSYLLAALILLIGLGSLAFHLFANRGSELADVVPIGLFMLVYVGIALNRFLAVPPGWTMLIAAGFAALVYVTLQLKCGGGTLGSPVIDSTGPSECLIGSIGYLPALLGLIVIGANARAGASGCALPSVGRACLRHFGDASLARRSALQQLHDCRAEGRHACRMAFVECRSAVPTAALESRGRAPDVAWTICPVQCGSAPMVGIHRRGC